MDRVMASELGFLGVNVDEKLTIDYIKTELVDKAEKGDKTVIFKLHNIARHYEGENAEEIKEFAVNALTRLGELEAEPAGEVEEPVEEEEGD